MIKIASNVNVPISSTELFEGGTVLSSTSNYEIRVKKGTVMKAAKINNDRIIVSAVYRDRGDRNSLPFLERFMHDHATDFLAGMYSMDHNNVDDLMEYIEGMYGSKEQGIKDLYKDKSTEEVKSIVFNIMNSNKYKEMERGEQHINDSLSVPYARP